MHGPKVSYEKKIEIFGTYGDIEKSAVIAADVRVSIQDIYVQMHGFFLHRKAYRISTILRSN